MTRDNGLRLVMENENGRSVLPRRNHRNADNQLRAAALAFGVHAKGDGYVGQCPICKREGKKPKDTLWLSTTGGRIVVSCRRGCSRKELGAEVERVTRRELGNAISRTPKDETEQSETGLPEASRRIIRQFKTADRATQHPYLIAKGVRAFGRVRIHDEELWIPMRDADGKLRNVQRLIETPGGIVKGGRLPSTFKKRFLEGVPTRGLHLWLGSPKSEL